MSEESAEREKADFDGSSSWVISSNQSNDFCLERWDIQKTSNLSVSLIDRTNVYTYESPTEENDPNQNESLNNSSGDKSEDESENIEARWQDVSSFGQVSSKWKTAGITFLVGTVTFTVGFFMLLAFAFFQNDLFLWLIFATSMLYFIFRLMGSYYLYVDAKILSLNARNKRAHYAGQIDSLGWAPRPVFWFMITFFVPPFVHYGPFIVYLFRRRIYARN